MPADPFRLRRTGISLEAATLGWNVIGVVLLANLAYRSGSVALFGFGLDSLIEIGASTVVIWELTGADERRRRTGIRLIGVAFVLLALYLLVQSAVALLSGHRAIPLLGGIGWTALTAVVMFALAVGKGQVGRALRDPVLIAEGRVTMIDGVLAAAVLLGIVLDALLGWWWADPAAGLVIVFYAVREAVHALRGEEI